jgi:SAM-dependent methyltransferase
MLRLATQHAPLATFVRASLVEVELPSCAAVTAIGECVNYLFDERNTAGALGQLIGRVHHALLPGGVFVLDVAGPGRAGPGRVTEMFHDHDGWAMRVRVEEGADGVLTRDMTLFCAAGDVDGHFRRIDERHGLRLYRPADMTRALRDAGFRVRRLRGYGDLRFGPGWAGFIATKS